MSRKEAVAGQPSALPRLIEVERKAADLVASAVAESEALVADAEERAAAIRRETMESVRAEIEELEVRLTASCDQQIAAFQARAEVFERRCSEAGQEFIEQVARRVVERALEEAGR